MIFETTEKNDQSFLLTIGEHIFNHKFVSLCRKRSIQTKYFLPRSKKLILKNLIFHQKIYSGYNFKNGGATILFNSRIHALISYFPIGQKGKGGHNHIDMGSFTISIDGKQIIGDPGSYSYNRNKTDRDLFRSAEMHNTMIYKDEKLDLSKSANFKISEYFKIIKSTSKKNIFDVSIINKYENKLRRRKYLINKKSFIIENYGLIKSDYYCYLIIHPDCKIFFDEKEVMIDDKIKIIFDKILSIKLEKIKYSSSYNILQNTTRIKIKARNHSIFKFQLI